MKLEWFQRELQIYELQRMVDGWEKGEEKARSSSSVRVFLFFRTQEKRMVRAVARYPLRFTDHIATSHKKDDVFHESVWQNVAVP